MSDGQVLYAAPGPVAARFQTSKARIRAIMGPIGSGKTSACLIDLVLKAQRSAPQPDGWRRFKIVVIRDTYRNLEKTTIPTWHRWFPRETGVWYGGEGGRPAKHTIQYDPGDGAPVELMVEFIGLNENRVEDVMRGFEFTAVYINEADLLPRDVLTYVISRWGRYPGKDAEGKGGPSWWGATLDLNAPDSENWVYHDFVEGGIEGAEFFRQPGGLEANAENLDKLPGGRNYYLDLKKHNPDWWTRRFVDNEFGYSRDGRPVYPEFHQTRHVAAMPLAPAAGIALQIGADAGGTPAAAVGQRLPSGQWVILDEIVAEVGAGMGPARFGEAINRLLAEPRYKQALAGWRLADGVSQPIVGYADPAAMHGADREAGEKNWIEAVSHATAIKFRAAPTNELTTRLEAVRAPLARTIDGSLPGLLISPTCKKLIKGLAAGYRYRRVQLAGSERYDDKPEKNEFSHVQDALQYLLSGGGEYLEVTGRRERRERALAARAAPVEEYDPMKW